MVLHQSVLKDNLQNEVIYMRNNEKTIKEYIRFYLKFF